MEMLAKFPRFKLYNDWFDFFSSVILFRFSRFIGHDQYFHIGMEGSLHNGSFFDSFQHKQNEKDFFSVLPGHY